MSAALLRMNDVYENEAGNRRPSTAQRGPAGVWCRVSFMRLKNQEPGFLLTVCYQLNFCPHKSFANLD
jgi:hypothetical protein